MRTDGELRHIDGVGDVVRRYRAAAAGAIVIHVLASVAALAFAGRVDRVAKGQGYCDISQCGGLGESTMDGVAAVHRVSTSCGWHTCEHPVM
jgi:hypothetical protein